MQEGDRGVNMKSLWALRKAAEGDLSRHGEETIRTLLEAGYITRGMAQRALQRARRREYLMETGKLRPEDAWSAA